MPATRRKSRPRRVLWDENDALWRMKHRGQISHDEFHRLHRENLAELAAARRQRKNEAAAIWGFVLAIWFGIGAGLGVGLIVEGAVWWAGILAGAAALVAAILSVTLFAVSVEALRANPWATPPDEIRRDQEAEHRIRTRQGGAAT